MLEVGCTGLQEGGIVEDFLGSELVVASVVVLGGAPVGVVDEEFEGASEVGLDKAVEEPPDFETLEEFVVAAHEVILVAIQAPFLDASAQNSVVDFPQTHPGAPAAGPHAHPSPPGWAEIHDSS